MINHSTVCRNVPTCLHRHAGILAVAHWRAILQGAMETLQNVFEGFQLCRRLEAWCHRRALVCAWRPFQQVLGLAMLSTGPLRCWMSGACIDRVSSSCSRLPLARALDVARPSQHEIKPTQPSKAMYWSTSCLKCMRDG
jgi:hypothetical protein